MVDGPQNREVDTSYTNFGAYLTLLGKQNYYGAEYLIGFANAIFLIIIAFSVKPDLNMVVVASTSHLGYQCII
jgi:hypothetical protein